MADELKAWIADMPGAVDLKFRLERSRLYSVSELYRGFDSASATPFAQTLDHQIWTWTRNVPDNSASRVLSQREKIAARIHDTSIDALVARFLNAKHQVTIGVMGGHDVDRTDPAFESIARIARELRCQGYMIVTGGGPGLMEAANFGAFLAGFPDEALFNASLATLKSAPSYADKVGWVRAAMEVRATLLGGDWEAEAPAASANLGIPTWYYGAEPPNLFATCAGKYFFNSLREDGLVTVANGGLIFGKGEAGTVQEVFQNANLNYYVGKAGAPTPMAFFGKSFWDPTSENDRSLRPAPDPLSKPVYPLVEALGRQAGIKYQPFDSFVTVADDVDAIVAFMKTRNTDRIKPDRIADRRLEMAWGRSD